MTVYLAFEPTQQAYDPMKTVFIRRGFSWGALCFGSLWALMNRLWIIAASFLAAEIVIEQLLKPKPHIMLLIGLALNLLLGFEGNNLKAQQLKRRGFFKTARIDEDNREDAEFRYYYNRLKQSPSQSSDLPHEIASEGPSATTKPTLLPHQDPLGLFGDTAERLGAPQSGALEKAERLGAPWSEAPNKAEQSSVAGD